MNKKILKTALITSLFLSQLAFANERHQIKIQPTEKYHARLIKDVTFSSFGGWTNQESLRMDIISPLTKEPTPCIVYITGNAFRYADRSINLPMLTDFARDGYTVVLIDWRASANSQWPAQIEDAKTAVRFLRANAKKYNIDPDRIGAWGHSSGATLASLLGTTGDTKDFDKGDWQGYSSSVKAVVNWEGGVNLKTIPVSPATGNFNTQELLVGGKIDNPADQAKFDAVSPATYISKQDPPFLLMYGDIDPAIPFKENGEYFYNELTKGGVDATFYEVIGGRHSSAQFTNDPQIMKIVKNFLDKNLKVNK